LWETSLVTLLIVYMHKQTHYTLKEKENIKMYHDPFKWSGSVFVVGSSTSPSSTYCAIYVWLFMLQQHILHAPCV